VEFEPDTTPNVVELRNMSDVALTTEYFSNTIEII
jgi:hypothetical protein